MCNIAMISMHTCPQACPDNLLGGRETGGMNVYIRELSLELSRRGKKVDVFTRYQDPNTEPIHELGDGARVIHLEAGPKAPYDKNLLPNHVDEFVAQIERFALKEGIRYDLVHGHYWVSGLVAHELQRKWGLPMVQMFHTLGAMKNLVAKSGADREVDERMQIERQVMDWADRIIAATPLDKNQMLYCYRAHDAKISLIPDGARA